MPDSELWLQRKRRTVDLMHMSSLRFLAWLKENGETMEDRKLRRMIMLRAAAGSRSVCAAAA